MEGRRGGMYMHVVMELEYISCETITCSSALLVHVLVDVKMESRYIGHCFEKCLTYNTTSATCVSVAPFPLNVVGLTVRDSQAKSRAVENSLRWLIIRIRDVSSDSLLNSRQVMSCAWDVRSWMLWEDFPREGCTCLVDFLDMEELSVLIEYTRQRIRRPRE